MQSGRQITSISEQPDVPASGYKTHTQIFIAINTSYITKPDILYMTDSISVWGCGGETCSVKMGGGTTVFGWTYWKEM
jgi:hypothetical protein